LKIDPTHLPCTFNAGRALFELGNFPKATDYYRRAVAFFEVIDKSNFSKVLLANSQAAMVYAYWGLGKLQQALHLAANAISIATDLERVQIFSPITYTWLSSEEFIDAVSRLASEIRGQLELRNNNAIANAP
jgi:tetratricopeptide (TPR) repeat protein